MGAFAIVDADISSCFSRLTHRQGTAVREPLTVSKNASPVGGMTVCSGKYQEKDICFEKRPCRSRLTICVTIWLFIRNPSRLAEYGRGAGYPWWFSDWFSNKGMIRRCEADHGKGNCEPWGAVSLFVLSFVFSFTIVVHHLTKRYDPIP